MKIVFSQENVIQHNKFPYNLLNKILNFISNNICTFIDIYDVLLDIISPDGFYCLLLFIL